ncbi:hypothetical protein F5Y08DRAFT_341262 [Xylaria arbuscula]|nr:hypothetical protein F5Y08DRAFT_341262 [Xylaria arbuscula]
MAFRVIGKACQSGVTDCACNMSNILQLQFRNIVINVADGREIVQLCRALADSMYVAFFSALPVHGIVFLATCAVLTWDLKSKSSVDHVFCDDDDDDSLRRRNASFSVSGKN